MTILYVSHRLSEIFAIADRVTVLKDGQIVGTHEVDGRIDRDFIVGEMVGRAWRDQFPERVRGTGDEVLRVEGLTRLPIFEDVSFTIHTGEILGLAGLVGSGRTKLCKALFGAAPYEGGTIYVDGRPASIRSPRDAIAHGIAYLSEDRHHEGVVLPLSIAKNVTLPVLGHFAPHVDPRHHLVGELPLPREVEDTVRANRPRTGKVTFLAIDRRQHHPLVVAVLGEVGDAMGDGVARRADRRRAAIDVDRAALVGRGAEERLAQLGAAGADQPGETEDLAGVDREAHVLEDRQTGQALDPEHLVAGAADPLRKLVAPGTSDHLADDEVPVDPAIDLVGADDLAVLQDRDPVGDRKDLAQAVGDVEDGHAWPSAHG